MTDAERIELLTTSGLEVRYQGSVVAVAFPNIPELVWTGKTLGDALKPFYAWTQRMYQIGRAASA